MKILNLYAGIGGNRMLWGDEHEITAVEYIPEVAAIYQHLFPKDKVVIEDAHEYLRKHFREFDFIWASPPCPTHSVLQMTRYYDEDLKYPDMTLYQEIIWLQTFFKGKWCIENVKPYYKPLITPTFHNKALLVEKVITLGKPFALLLPMTWLNDSAPYRLFSQGGVELMIFDRRVKFKNCGNQPSFGVGYYCRGILPEKIVFESLGV